MQWRVGVGGRLISVELIPAHLAKLVSYLSGKPDAEIRNQRPRLITTRPNQPG
jgi:hypothetical protein